MELGGMRFLNTHRRVVALVEHFGLETEPLPVADPQDRHLVYLRGQYSTGADWGGRASTRPTGSTAASAPAPPASCCSRW